MRFERAAVYEGIQFGVETTPGTPVAANKQLLGLSLNFDKMTDIKPYRPQGVKFDTTSQVGKEFTGGRFEGIPCYNDLVYEAAWWLTNPTPSVPANNSTFTVSTIASGTFGFTYKGSVLAPATWASAAALQTAIGALASVGAGNVLVTGPLTAIVIQFIGALSTDTSVPGAVTGTATATITAQATGTLTNRWKYLMNQGGPDNVSTATFQKGPSGVASMGQQAAFGFVDGMKFKFTPKDANFTGNFCAQTTTDAISMTGSPTAIACVPVNPKDVTIYAGTTLNNLVLVDRFLEIEIGVESRAQGLMTLNANDPSFSNRIEGVPNTTGRFFAEHDAVGQALLADMRAGTPVWIVVEAKGSAIETGFPYRMKWTTLQSFTKATEADVDAVFGHNFDMHLQIDPTTGIAIQLEVDSPLSTL
jgi:hypothetical protein